MRFLALLFWVVFVSCQRVLAQEALPVPRAADHLFVAKQWQTGDGLPQNSVNAMTQTDDGYLWLGTFNGLVRFDGIRFTTYTSANTPELAADNIVCLQNGPDGSLWIVPSPGGIVRLREGIFSNVPVPEGLGDANIRYFCNDPNGVMWAGSMGEIMRYNGEKFILAATVPPALYPIRGMAVDRANRFWVGTKGGLRRLVGSEFQPTQWTNSQTHSLMVDQQDALWHFEDGIGLLVTRGETTTLKAQAVAPANSSSPGATTAPAAASGTQWQVAESQAKLSGAPQMLVGDFNGRVWLGAGGPGLRYLDEKGLWEFRSTPLLDRYDIGPIMADQAGNLWLGLDGGGLARLRQKRAKTLEGRAGEPFNNTVTVAQARDGRIFAGRLGSQGGLSWLNPGDDRLSLAPAPFDRMWVSSCYPASDGSLWLGTYGLGLYRRQSGQWSPIGNDPRALGLPAGSIIKVFLEDAWNGFWIGTATDGVFLRRNNTNINFVKANGLSDNFVTALCADQAGNVWAGTQLGLNRISPAGEIRQYHRPDGLAVECIQSLFTDRRGTVWIGLAGGGLTRQDAAKFRALTSAQGLINDVVAQILEDDDGNLWVGTNRGIARMARPELDAYFKEETGYVRSVTYGLAEGMANEECGGGFQPACLKDAGGMLWFCTVGGLVKIDPRQSISAARAPKVFVEEVTLDGQRRAASPAGSFVDIPANTRRVEIRFTGLDFSAPDNIRFRHKLENYDKDWVDAGNGRIAAYTKLPPARYRFRVSAQNQAGLWSELDARLDLVVRPAWWQSGWFRALACASALAAAVGIHRLRVRGFQRNQERAEEFSRRLIESQEAERQRVARELHDGLGQSLLVIRNRAYVALEEMRDTPALERQLQEIWAAAGGAVQEVRQISHALRPSRLDRLGLTRTIQSLGEQLDEVGGVETKLALENIDAYLSPSDQINFLRIVQESVNNIIKHSKASRVEIATRLDADTVVLTIADDGCGFKVQNALAHQPSDGMGLMAISERVGFMGGQLQIDSEVARGTRLTIRIPRQKAVMA